jgi:hypothetical protein
MDGLELSDVIAKLRANLSKIQKDGASEEIRFLIDAIDVEFNVAVEDKGALGGGVKFYVLSAKAETSQIQTVTQKITLKMKALGPDGRRMRMNDEGYE